MVNHRDILSKVCIRIHFQIIRKLILLLELINAIFIIQKLVLQSIQSFHYKSSTRYNKVVFNTIGKNRSI